jgi:hypothetical protein
MWKLAVGWHCRVQSTCQKGVDTNASICDKAGVLLMAVPVDHTWSMDLARLRDHNRKDTSGELVHKLGHKHSPTCQCSAPFPQSGCVL